MACGFPHARTAWDTDEIEQLRVDIHRLDDLFLAVVKVALTDDPKILPPRDGAYLKNRMRAALLGPQAVFE